MTQIFIQQVQSVAGSVTLIILLLLVAGLIGYLTAWYYSKSIHSPVIKGLEADKNELKGNIEDLNDERKKLDVKIDVLNKNIATLERQIEEKRKEIKQPKQSS